MTILTSSSAMWLGGYLEDEPDRSRDLGPAPIGSDAWLRAEVQAALAREPALRGAPLVVEATDAVVTIRGATHENAALVERSARTVQGIKTLRVVSDGTEPRVP